MPPWKLTPLCLVYGALWVTASIAVGESVSDYAVRVSATVQTSPPQISFSWPADLNATGYKVYRKLRDATSWGVARNLAVNASSYVDTNVVIGSTYEYRFSKSALSYYGEGYIYAAIQAPLVETRGKVLLMVDNSFTASLSNELARLQQDLVGDGWSVLRHDVPRMTVDPANTSSSVWAARSNELANVKALITADYNADPSNVKAIFVFGHVPVPYSGNISPDDHLDHVGGWPADGFYGSINRTWPDSLVNDTTASDSRNWNLPGDEKFDPSYWPNFIVAVPVGRVDLANLPVFSQSEGDLLRQYLNKDHNFRHNLITAQRRGLVDDNFGLSTGEPLAAGGWRNFAAFFGASNSFAVSDWFGTLATNSYLWGYGCGGGTYTSCGGVGVAADFAANDPRVVFTMFFGSYFGDWDSQNNFLRSALGTTNYTLTSAWSGRPHWICHHMGLGEIVGFSTLVTQNNTDNYDFNNFGGSVHIALLGDPTLRMHPVAPPSGFLAVTNGSGAVGLSWTASPDSVLGYHVYRAPTAAGPFMRVNGSLLAGTNYTDPLVSSNLWYMVRAVKLEVSGSGSYSNASQGIFQTVSGNAVNIPRPALAISNVADASYLIQGAGSPGLIYRIQFASLLGQTNWQILGSATADTSGKFLFTNSAPAPQGFYRAVYP